jgi:diguanylate cyclase (GGDEF)-like protein
VNEAVPSRTATVAAASAGVVASAALWIGAGPAFGAMAAGFGAAAVLGTEYARLRRISRDDTERARQTLAAGSDACLFQWSPQSGAGWLGPRAEELLGVTHGPGRFDRWFHAIEPTDLARVQRDLDDVAAGHIGEARRALRATVDGSPRRDLELRAVRLPDGTVSGAITDVSDRRSAEARLAQTSFRDPLTGLSNRALLLDRVAHALARIQRNPSFQFAVLQIGLDRFQVVNEGLGTHVGDALILATAGRISERAGRHDVVARVGGDEFALLVEGEGATNAVGIAARLADELRTRYEILGYDLACSASVGVAIGQDRYRSAEDILRDAGTAMARAKAAGRARHAVFEYEMHARAVERVAMERDLRVAVGNGALEPHFQPIIDLRQGRVAGFEALVRWRTASGPIPPDRFLPVAEETGFVSEIDALVLDRALLAVRSFRQVAPDRPIWVAVNASGRDIREPGFADKIAAAVTRAGLPPEALKIELTETILVEGGTRADETIARLQSLGFGVALDDFGTGYSSLSYLHRFPVERIKLDRSFVTTLSAERTPRIAKTIIDLGRSLGLPVVAEGIESDAQLRALRAIGCDYGQGYLFSPALPAEAAAALLNSDPRF